MGKHTARSGCHADRTSTTAIKRDHWAASPIGLLTLLLVFIAGCGEPYCGGTPQYPTIIHMPGVQTVSAMTSILDVPSFETGSGVVEGITPFSGADGRQYALVTVSGTVYVLNLAESAVAPIAGLTCLGPAALSTNHLHLVCTPSSSFPGDFYCAVICAGSALTYVTLSSIWPPQISAQHTLDVGPDNSFSSPTWSPDGLHFAVLHRRIGGACTIDFESPVDDGTNFADTGELFLSSFDACDTRQLSWAPDGHALALSVNGSFLLVPMSQIPSALLRFGSVLATATLTPNLVAYSRDTTEWTIWSADSRSLIFIDYSDLQAVQSADIASRSIRDLFTLPTDSMGSIGPIGWTARGNSLLFAFGPRQYPPNSPPSTAPTSSAQLKLPVACVGNIPQTIMYAYTPPSEGSPGG